MSPSAAAPDGELAIEICTERLAVPDADLLAAVTAARAGTRTDAEVAESFRRVQDTIESLSREATPDYPRLAASLQSYADVLGRARVSGAEGVGDITEAREAVDVACYQPR